MRITKGTKRARITKAVAVVALMALTMGVGLSAHPTASTEIVLTFEHARAFEVAITTDAEPLVAKLEALAGKPASGPLSADALDGRIVVLQDTLLAQLDLEFDARPAALTLSGVGRSVERPGKVIVRMSGTMPVGATHATWRSTLVYGSYPFVVRSAADGRVGASAGGSATSSSSGSSGISSAANLIPGVPMAVVVDGVAVLEQFEWLNGPEISATYAVADLTRPAAPGGQFWRSVILGFTHILPNGLDHILFVLGLFLLASNTRTILLQVSAFTVAHSITLGLALYGVVALPARVVEPLIALSIAYVAFENLFTSSLKPWRVALVFAFGLLHGLGFAEALRALELPRSAFLGTLVAFNVGVEGGQLTVILAAALLVRALRVPAARYRRWVVEPASALIALAGVVWVVQRVW